MSRGRAASLVIALLAGLVPVLAQRGPARQQQAAATGPYECSVATPLKPLPGLPEASGLAMTRRPPTPDYPRRLFSINDSAGPDVHVFNLDGTPRGTVAIRGATVVDWEDVTSGPCPGGACLYVSDIGDNRAARPHVTIYRVPEPRDGVRELTAERFDAVYPDGPRDAEAIFTGRDGRLFLITKEPRQAGLYGFPEPLVAGQPNRLVRLASLSLGTGRGRLAQVTDAETSIDRSTVAIRTNDTLFLVPTPDLLRGELSSATVYPLRQLREPQGEGVAFGPGNEVFLAGEGRGRRAQGTFAALTCRERPLPRQ